jgi:hypothetical protein
MVHRAMPGKDAMIFSGKQTASRKLQAIPA